MHTDRALNRTKHKDAMPVAKAWKVVIEYQRLDLIKRLRAYDNRNHRGQYAQLCRETADFLELIGRHCK